MPRKGPEMKRKQKFGFSQIPPCHVGTTEVVGGLFCGGESEVIDMISKPVQVDTLIPLNKLEANIWDMGFRGEILYYPIHDYGILPDDVLDELVSKILCRINNNKKVGLFCFGGHGRTGYVASVVLGKLGYDDPIKFLRSKYCKNAVESSEQINHIAEVLEKPELAEEYAATSRIYMPDDYWGHYTLPSVSTGYISTHSSKSSNKDICKNCAYYYAGKCQEYMVYVQGNDSACTEFAKRV